MKPFRFGVQLSHLPPDDWRGRLRHIEALGYSTVFWPDHFNPMWDPATALAAAAATTERLRVGSLVYGIDYRHPVVLAKAAATLQVLSGGRHEFGLGAGWMESDYVQAGLAYDRPGLRIERLEEALQIIRGAWTQETTSFEGAHYSVRELPRAVAELDPSEPPRVLVGGGGPKVLAVAGRHADIVGINPKLTEGRVTKATSADATAERTLEKVRWVHQAAEAAGRDPELLELNALVFVVAISDDPGPVRGMISKQTGLEPEEIARCPLFLTGSASEIQDRLVKQRETTGISYVVVQDLPGDGLDAFAEGVMKPLVGV